MLPRIEINGLPPTAEMLSYPALVNYGHFTAMQVRNGKTRGLRLHLERLDAAHQELFDVGLDGDQVRDRIRHALGDDVRDASVRVVVWQSEGDAEASIMVSVKPPVEVSSRPQALRSVVCQRPVAHLKHVGAFGLIYHGTRAERDGFDDALLTDSGGVISEGTITNIGFFERGSVVWPDAPALRGITMQLLEQGLPGVGVPSIRKSARLRDLGGFDGGFVSNSRGVAPLGRIDNVALPHDPVLFERVAKAYESAPWDAI
ncbi:MAG: aminotransferase class IV family protein [Micromonosporaceae bacterium]